MRTYPYDEVVIDPTIGQLNVALGRALDASRNGYRVRLVDYRSLFDEVHRLVDVGDQSRHIDRYPVALPGDDWRWRDGGGVGVHRHGEAATSVLGLAWWHDPADRIHVRVVGGRVDLPSWAAARKIPGSRVARPFGVYNTKPWPPLVMWVYPVLHLRQPPADLENLPAELVRETREKPLDEATWSALNDYVAEHGPQLRDDYVVNSWDVASATHLIRRLGHECKIVRINREIEELEKKREAATVAAARAYQNQEDA